MIKPFLGQCHISNCLIMSEKYVIYQRENECYPYAQVDQEKLSSAVMVALYAGKSSIKGNNKEQSFPLGNVNLSKKEKNMEN